MAGSWPRDEGFGLCACCVPNAHFTLLPTVHDVGTDLTDGRYAEVEVGECTACGLLWLRYFVEYEAFSNSGRWARGIIGRIEAEQMTPERAQAYLESLPAYLYGGSYFDGKSGWRTGWMHWGL
jgi:hypothetical protein